MSSRLERLLAIEAYLRSGTFPTVSKICALFEVQQRTVYQDLKILRESFGLDVRYDRHRNGYYNANPEKRLPPMALSEREAKLLLLAIETLCQLGGASFRGALAGVVDLVANGTTHASSSLISEIVDLPGSASQVSCSLFLRLMDACLEGHVIALACTDETDPEASVQLIPDRLLLLDNRWHLAGRKPHCDDDAVVPIDTISAVHLATATE